MALFTALSFVLYLVGVSGRIAVFLASVCAMCAVLLGAHALGTLRRDDRGASEETGWKGMFVAAAAVIAAALQVAFAAWLAVRTPFSAVDAWSFWILKARMFALGGPRPGYFRDPLTLHTHPDYPLNVPLAAAAFLRVPGQAGVALAALIGPACLAALLLLLYGGLTRLYGRLTAALAVVTLSVVPEAPVQAASGNVDIPLALYVGATALYLLLWWRLRRPVDAVLMGLLAGGAAWTKKEGLPIALLLLGAYALGEVWRWHATRSAAKILWRVALRRAAAVLAAAIVLPLPWTLFSHLTHPLARDFLPFTLAGFLAHAGRLPHIVAMFLLQPLAFENWSLFWVVLAALLIAAARRLTPAAYGLLLLLLCQEGVYVISFVFSDWQPYTAHVRTSLDRLLMQAVPLALLLMVETVHALCLRARSGMVPAHAAPGDPGPEKDRGCYALGVSSGTANLLQTLPGDRRA